MGNFTRGKDGKMYYGKGTQGGLAPTPPTFNAAPSIPSMPTAPALPGDISNDAIGSYSKFELIKNGFTVDEVTDIETRPAIADLPKTSWGKLALEEADRSGYETISKLSGGKYMVAAAYDNLVENHKLHEFTKNADEAKAKAYDSTVPIQKLLMSMKSSSAENNYSQEDIARIDRIMAGYTEPSHINTRAFTIDSSGGDERIVYTNDMVRILDLAKVSYKEEKESPSQGTLRLMEKAESQRRYMKHSTSGAAVNGGYIKFDKKPSRELVDARIKVKLLEKEYYTETQKSTRFDILGRQEKKVADLGSKLAQFRQTLNIMENRKTN
jgi:hypothetical protein